MAKDFNVYVNKAIVKFESGFTSKSSKTEALGYLSSAYEILSQNIRDLYLDIPRESRTEEQENVYWGLANTLGNWKEKHTKLVLSVFPEAVIFTNEIEELVKLRLSIREQEVVKVERKEKERLTQVTKSIHEIIKLRKEQYQRGLVLHDIFKKLPVSMNWHYVTNQHGTDFIRVFYYMGGVLTPLNVILAVLEKTEEENVKN